MYIRISLSSVVCSTYIVTGKPKLVTPSTIREDYHLNPCQPIDVPEGKEKENCEKGTWVCKDTKLITEDKETKETLLFLHQIAGSAPADDTTKTPARDVNPLAIKADKLEDVKDRRSTIAEQNSDVEFTRVLLTLC